ncbi:kinase-like protein [Gymnopus androsaceus JB14]|uniref:Kinase-like protein n=1 Tax=Gymnopus androsaceus JB14 TaxID=1447944 RepID=A0A6A4I153_9AGAR|nr:kinase-like protein [Gymnopus androsaceus JB14]
MSRHHPHGGGENSRTGSQGITDTPGPSTDSHVRAESRTVNITRKVLDRDGQTQAHLICSTSGVWIIHPVPMGNAFTVKFDDISFRNVLASKKPWDNVEWNTPLRIDILLELLYWESRLSVADDFKFELFRCTRRIVREFEILPSSLYLRGLTKEGNHPTGGGGYADIWKGQTANGDPVCLKVLRVFTTEASRKEIFKEFSREALIWSQLEHPNVLPFLGTNVDLFPESYCLVSPWCSHGNVMIYLSTHPGANKMRIIWDIVKGLEYLHTRNTPVVHGDLKGANILVSDLGKCRLADFGLAGMMSTLQTLSSSTGNGTGGSVRWMAPELFDFTTNSRPSTLTDVYSLGCTVFEIVTGSPPFSEVKPDIAVSIQVMRGYRPLRPVEGFSDLLWTTVQRCWLNPDNRHTVKTFMEDPSMRAWITEVSYDDSESLEEKTRDVVPIVATGRRTRNTLKGKGEAIWPPYLDAALIEGLVKYTPDGSQSSKASSRFIMRNRFISDYIFETTGKRRSQKQVGNRLQQLRDTRKRDKTMRDEHIQHTGKTIWVNIVLERSSWSSPPPVINIVNNEKVMPLVIHLAPASGVNPSLSRFDSINTGLLSNLVTFASPYTVERHCSFSVFADKTGPPIHTESAVLTEHLREKSSESLYGVSLVLVFGSRSAKAPHLLALLLSKACILLPRQLQVIRRNTHVFPLSIISHIQNQVPSCYP